MARRGAERARADRLARQWRAGGLSAREFAERHGLSVWTLRYWSQRLTKATRALRRERRGGFAAVRLTPDGPEAQGPELQIALASGDVVRVTGDIAIDRIRDIVTLLRSGC